MSILPKDKQWIAHSGRREKLRHLRRSCAPFLKPDHPSAEAVQKIKDFMGGGQFSEYGVLMALHHAIQIADDTGVTLTESIEIMLASLPEKETKMSADEVMDIMPRLPEDEEDEDVEAEEDELEEDSVESEDAIAIEEDNLKAEEDDDEDDEVEDLHEDDYDLERDE